MSVCGPTLVGRWWSDRAHQSQWEAIPMLLIFVGTVETMDKLQISLHWRFSILRAGVVQYKVCGALGTYRGVRRWHSWTYLAFTHSEKSQWNHNHSVWLCVRHPQRHRRTLRLCSEGRLQSLSQMVLDVRASLVMSGAFWNLVGYICALHLARKDSPKVKISI